MNSSNSSTLAPQDEGNTDPKRASSCVKKTKQPSGKTQWIVTINVKDWNSSNSSSLTQWIENHCTEAVWQVEKGESGNLHVQLTMVLKKKNRLTWLKRHFCQIAHLEEVVALEKAFDYCSKKETRILEPRYFPKPINAVAVEDELKYLEPYAWQKEILEIITTKPDKRKIYWYWDTSGCSGKTTLVRHILLNYDAILLDGAKRDMAFAWNGEPIVLCNFSRAREGKISYDGLESIKDGIVFSAKYESKQKVFNRPHLICFANWTPAVESMSSDRWIIKDISNPI